MIDAEYLKQKIKNKFRTRSRFARIAGLDEYVLQRLLNEKNVDPERLERIDRLCDLHENTTLLDEISDEERVEIRKRINAEGGVRQFCLNNPQFNKSTVYQIVIGIVKKKDKTAEQLIKFFNI